jgi:hypothetical protein
MVEEQACMVKVILKYIRETETNGTELIRLDREGVWQTVMNFFVTKEQGQELAE